MTPGFTTSADWVPNGRTARTATCGTDIKGAAVSGTDKVKNAMQDVEGKAKEAMGKVTGNERQKNEGRADQTKSDVKNAGENVKDAFKH